MQRNMGNNNDDEDDVEGVAPEWSMDPMASEPTAPGLDATNLTFFNVNAAGPDNAMMGMQPSWDGSAVAMDPSLMSPFGMTGYGGAGFDGQMDDPGIDMSMYGPGASMVGMDADHAAPSGTEEEPLSPSTSNFASSVPFPDPNVPYAPAVHPYSHPSMGPPATPHTPTSPAKQPTPSTSKSKSAHRPRLSTHSSGNSSKSPRRLSSSSSSAATVSSVAHTEGRGPRSKRDRERNRLAAAKCRQKAKDDLAELEGRERELHEQNRELTQQATSLRNEVLDLKTLVLNHGECDSESIQDYIAKQARKVGF